MEKNLTLRQLLTIILSVTVLQALSAQQQSIKGVVNTYYSVSTVGTNSITASAGEDVSTLQPGDKVILMEMTGVTVTISLTSNAGFTTLGNAGKYEMLYVSSVNTGTRTVTFTQNIKASFTNGEKIQLVKIYEADYASVDSTLTAADWDGNKGGVLALLILKKLTLNANIDVSKKGFLGAMPASVYPDVCQPTTDTFYYGRTDAKVVGFKGEGNIMQPWDSIKGPGRAVIGGGGGLGWFAGGGGGANFGSGGNGGSQKKICTSSVPTASGGINMDATGPSAFYDIDTTGGIIARVTMGGGGGSSTEDGTYLATKGGDGGGIIIIITDTLEANSHSFIADGESVSTTATAGGGGGGAGGDILLDINYYVNTLNAYVRGGKGGNASIPDSTGAGGGGGGGVLWYSGISIPPAITYYTTKGSGGTGATLALTGYTGGTGTTLGNLVLPLNGFLFNSIDGTDTICAGQIPGPIAGTDPKGGTTAYSYSWIRSTDSLSWTVAGGTNDQKDYQPLALSQTTYFKRVVNSGTVYDTSLPVKIYVWPAISNNILTITDTLCFNQSPGNLTGGVVTGGNGSFRYQWQSDTTQINWNNRVTTASLNEGTLTKTTYYRRIVSSAQCSDTSNVDTITVLPSIGNNAFANVNADTAICNNFDAGIIKTTGPTGGDGIYRYQWLVSTNNSAYTLVPLATGNTYAPGILTAGSYDYKRIAKSGNGDVCMDTSSAYPITVYNSISGNTLKIDSSRYCYNDVPHQMSQVSALSGGNNTYTYQWISKVFNGTSWQQIASGTGASYTPSAGYTDTLYISRVVTSGNYKACIDTAPPLRIDIIPQIQNTLSSIDTQVCQNFAPLPFTEAPATGGAGGFSYLWQSQVPGTSTWNNAAGTNNQVSYSAGALTDTTLFRRSVTSQICTSISNSVKVIVYPVLQNNLITGGSIQFTCYNTQKSISASPPSGGDIGSYSYSWQTSADDATWADAGGTQQTYQTTNLTDSMFYRRMVFSGPNNECSDTSSSVLIRINPLPQGDIVTSRDTLCSGDTLMVDYNITAGKSPWMIKLGATTPVDSQSVPASTGTLKFQINNAGSAIYKVVELKDANGCSADLTGNTGEIDLLTYQVPNPNAGVDSEICGQIYQFDATNSVGQGMWYASDSSVFSDPTQANTTVTSANYGTVNFTWKVTNGKCENSDTVGITFDEMPDSVNAGADFQIDNNFDTTLTASIPLVGTGTWTFSPNNPSEVTFENKNDPNTPVHFNQQYGNYLLYWTVINGVCPAVMDSVNVEITGLKFYQGFSPNNDGKNDEYVVKLTGNHSAHLIILDSKGRKINDLTNQNNPKEIRWDGKNLKGEDVPSGTYYYLFTETGQKTRSGFIELRR